MSIVADVVVVVDNILHDYNVAGVVVADDVEPEIEDDVDGAVQLFGYGSVFAAGDDADVDVAAVAVVVDAAAAAAAAVAVADDDHPGYLRNHCFSDFFDHCVCSRSVLHRLHRHYYPSNCHDHRGYHGFRHDPYLRSSCSDDDY